MQKQGNNIAPGVFSLASNLFGMMGRFTEPESVPMPIDPPKRIMAVYPAIVQEAFSQSMDNYRRYVAGYNFQTAAENELIDRHNATVKAHLRQHPLDQTQAQLLAMIRYRLIQVKHARDYNQQVEEFCCDHGPILSKRRIATVKYGSEQVFANLLHLYSSQLLKRNTQYMSLGVITARPIQELAINANMVTQLKRNGVKSLALCSKSIRNHRQRLEECGVLQEQRFQGWQRAVLVQINPEILVVIDMKNNQLVFAGNQSINPSQGKVLPDNNENTRTIIKEYERKADHHPPDKEFATLTPERFAFYKNTRGTVTNSPGGAAEKNVNLSPDPQPLSDSPPEGFVRQPVNGIPPAPAIEKPAANLSQYLEQQILHPTELASRLADHEFDTYTPIPLGYLRHEAFNGTMVRSEFRELVIQDLFKSAARLYRESTPFAGSWKLALNLYYERKFISFTGEPFNKDVVFSDIEQLRWRLQYAYLWFKHNPVKPLYPSQYFDFTRTEKKEIGFEFTKKAWAKHLKWLQQKQRRKRESERRAELRKRNINHAKKCETEIRRFLCDKITLEQLHDYVQANLPAEFLERLPQMILKLKDRRDNPPSKTRKRH